MSVRKMLPASSCAPRALSLGHMIPTCTRQQVRGIPAPLDRRTTNPAPHQHGTHPDVARLLAALILRLHRNGNIHLDTASFVADESFVHIGMTLTGFVQTAIS